MQQFCFCKGGLVAPQGRRHPIKPKRICSPLSELSEYVVLFGQERNIKNWIWIESCAVRAMITVAPLHRPPVRLPHHRHFWLFFLFFFLLVFLICSADLLPPAGTLDYDPCILDFNFKRLDRRTLGHALHCLVVNISLAINTSGHYCLLVLRRQCPCISFFVMSLLAIPHIFLICYAKIGFSNH
jgi:hypothetical protein